MAIALSYIDEGDLEKALSFSSQYLTSNHQMSFVLNRFINDAGKSGRIDLALRALEVFKASESKNGCVRALGKLLKEEDTSSLEKLHTLYPEAFMEVEGRQDGIYLANTNQPELAEHLADTLEGHSKSAVLAAIHAHYECMDNVEESQRIFSKLLENNLLIAKHQNR